ncbi:putative mediator of RNA polymerase II transcription subunit 26 [Malaya genurostris]|uniref:putative mediator of RNA polymerase II transcription subunit 26 n=1 Tax=Malaya genurostris TaxID=325434 RepID=UPI0026F3FA5F|nr:putative mediator of RNA polymerase II transcription subunit 26 [Malaya genurostris]XP_058447343.1 putative mediator of RNA polymerase II transcription subunit 26 [Malaya genurostris]XP_058447344.1 putative mediator of RNA polymerase II transcription subunit 26 [Malaya genurostris]
MATATSLRRLRHCFGSVLQLHLLWMVMTVLIVNKARTQQTTLQKSQVLNDGSFKFGAKTRFSCSGRAAGYYADVETGCQIYHMCDGLGRQFSYSCPNTTLFQQRMLICDHWYMVNCSKAESNYAANLLIGQRDKPFVAEDENEIRTPRPDLLDRPYSASFAGEPIMYNFIKTNTQAPQNAIALDKKLSTKVPSTKGRPSEIFEESASNHGLPIHWNTRYAKEDTEQEKVDQKQALDDLGSTAIPLNSDEERLQNNKVNGRRDVTEDESKDESRNTARFASSENRTSKVVNPSSSGLYTNAVNVKVPSIRYEPPFTPEEQSKKETNRKDTLGPEFKPFESVLNFNKKGNRKDYDFSNFFTRNGSFRNTVPTTKSTVATTTTVRPTTRSTVSSTRFSTLAPVTSRFTTTTRQPSFSTVTTTSTTQRPVVLVPNLQLPNTNPAQFLPRTSSGFQPLVITTTTTSAPSTTVTAPTTALPRILSDPRQSNRPPTTILFNAPAATAGLFENRFALQRPAVVQASVPVPSSEILPPFENLANYDNIKSQYVNQAIFTRQPITNEPSAGPINSGIDKLREEPVIQVRKDNIPRPFSVPTPSNEILPPKKDYVFYDDATTQGPPIYYQWKWSIPSFGLDPPLDAPLTDEEKLLSQLNPTSAENSSDSSREHNQTARSISSETGNLGENQPSSSLVQLNKRRVQPPAHNYLELRKNLAIPDFTFPLESEVGPRNIYEHDGAVNSFQIKIPSYARSDDSNTTWYGENAKCPHCHPVFLRPGSCEPCVKIRR